MKDEKAFLSNIQSYVSDKFKGFFYVEASIDDSNDRSEEFMVRVSIFTAKGGEQIAYRNVSVEWTNSQEPFGDVASLLPGGTTLMDPSYKGAGTILMAAVEDYFRDHHRCPCAEIFAGMTLGGYKWLQYGYWMGDGALENYKERLKTQIKSLQSRLGTKSSIVPETIWQELRDQVDRIDPSPEGRERLIALSQYTYTLEDHAKTSISGEFLNKSSADTAPLHVLFKAYRSENPMLLIGQYLTTENTWHGFLDFSDKQAMERRAGNIMQAWERLATTRVAHAIGGCFQPKP